MRRAVHVRRASKTFRKLEPAKSDARRRAQNVVTDGDDWASYIPYDNTQVRSCRRRRLYVLSATRLSRADGGYTVQPTRMHTPPARGLQERVRISA